MILVLLLVSKLIHSIHGIDVCPPAPPFDPTCLARLIMPGCSSDQDCTKPGTKCCRSDCGVLQCVQSIQGVIKVGICPPLPPVRPGFCLAARISSDCDGNDANCPGQKKCCPTICGSQNCRDPITEERKECPAVPVPGAQCFRFDQQCSSDLDCPKSQICCGVICGTGCRDPVVPYTPHIEDPRPGVCPPVKPGVICNALLISDCTGKDSECTTPGYKCCPGACNSQRCQEPITEDRPGCPAINPDLRCIVYRQHCNSDRDCDEGQQCCFQPSCGTSCQAVTPLNPMCPPYRKDVVCIHFDEQCTTNDDCKVGDICCTIECGTACKTPYRPPYEDPQCKPVLCDLHCDLGFARDGNGCEICRCSQKTCPPRVQLCINIPSGACSKENFLIIDGGVRCPLCPSIIPCNKDCLLPVQPGPCKGAFKRYYYNVDTNSCTEFVYGGCQGNNNNFNSLQECEEKCSTNPTVPVEKPGICPYNNNPDQNCVGPVRPAECQDDSGCPGERKCCRVGCFQVCIDPEPVCPPVCAIFCEFGNVVDSNGCPTCKCRDKPCPPDPTCPIPPLVPPGECPRRCRFVYEDIDGVSCKVRCELGPAGPTVLPCLPSNCIQEPTDPHPPPLPACEKGIPLVSIQCGLGGQLCPSGYYCAINWCCQIPCKNGTPHPTLTCGQVAGSNNCPTGYSCLAHPADAYFACCPDDSYGNCPNGSPLPNYFCGRGPSHQDCPSGFSCNTDPADRFAVCCPDITGNCPNGNPLPNYFCGRGPSHQDCPPGYSCNTDPADRFAVCCPDRMKYGSCPPVKPDTAGICVELCSGDASCPGKEKCCSNGCGHVCTNPTEEHICALIKCPVNCEYGYELDNYGCQTCNCKPDPCPKPVCIPPPEGSCTEADYKIYNGVKCMWCPKIIECKPQPCPLPSCVPPPPLSCTEPDFKIFNGVKCPWCPRIVPCKPSCEAGMPLPNINCGLRPDRQDCPAGFFCNVDPIDRFAVCCPECTRGKPLPNVLCDDVNRKCPSGYQCKKIHGICCPTPCLPPPCPPPPQGACIEPQFTIIDGVTCPACYKIVPCKDKLCPAVPAESRCYEYTKECEDDNSCTDGRKCCRQGCSYVCLNPV